LVFFRDKEFANNWFNTGTPTFLIEQIRKNDDLKPFINKEEVEEVVLRDTSDYNEVGNISLLFQTGYLTIKKKEMKENGSIYTIDLPNLEVEKSFLMSLQRIYI
jgi:hypothetical protein